jgi:TolB-like protein/Flp pilus assembly protein TadD
MAVVDELKRRNVLKVVFTYLVVGWLLTEVLTTILPELGAPQWASRMVILVFALGFLPAAILPWIYEITPTGIKRESDIARGDAARSSGRVFDYVAIVAATILIVVIAVLGARTTVDESSPTDAEFSPASVAVLPFANMTGDPSNDYFSDGLTETLLHMLAQIPDLQVAARTSSFAFKGQSKTIREIAQALSVAHVLEGSVQLSENRVRITAQLIRAGDGFHVWSNNFERDFDDIFAIQDEIARTVGSALSASLLGNDQSTSISGFDTENPDAYDLYLQALAERATFSYGGLQAAENLLKGALATDPGFLDAKTELAINYLHQYETGLITLDEALTSCSAMTRQVLAVRPDDPMANALRVYVSVAGDAEAVNPGRIYDAIDELDRLVAENPAIYQIRILLGQILQRVQKYDRALVVHLEALQKEPYNPRVHYELGSLYLLLDRPTDARAALERSLELESRQPNAYVRLARVSSQLGDGVATVKHLLRAFEIDPRDHELPAGIALFLYGLGLVEEGDDFRNLVHAVAPTSEIAYLVELRRAISLGDVSASEAAARRIIEDDVGDRKGTFSEAVQQLMRIAVTNGTISETTDYLEQHAPGIFDIRADALPHKYRAAQIAALGAWYVSLPREELLQRLDDLLGAASDFGIDPLADPANRLGVNALRGETEAAVKLALEQVFTHPVTRYLLWREEYSQPMYADIVADERVRDALHRRQAEYDDVRDQVRAYLASISESA